MIILDYIKNLEVFLNILIPPEPEPMPEPQPEPEVPPQSHNLCLNLVPNQNHSLLWAESILTTTATHEGNNEWFMMDIYKVRIL